MVTPIETFVLEANQMGVPLVLLWLLTLAIVWGLLQHAKTPSSAGARGVISITAAFLVMMAVAASTTVAFLQNLITASVLIAFGLLVVVMFLEIAGVKMGEGKTIFQGHPKFFGAMILILVLAVFLGAGGMAIIGIPNFQISEALLAFLVFIGVVIAAVYLMMQETGGKKEK